MRTTIFAMKRIIFKLVAIVVILSPCQAEEAVREWTNTEGKTITATLMEVDETKVTLRLENGRRYEVPLDSLSESDREFCSEWIASEAAESKAKDMALEYGVPAELIVRSPFSEDTPPTRKGMLGEWNAGIGEWRIEEGALIGDEVAEDNHASSLTYKFEASDLIITAQVKLGTAEQMAFACRDNVPPNLHLGRLYITPDKLWIQHMAGIAKTTKSERIAVEEVEIDVEEWYDVTIEIVGETYRAKVGEHEIEATHPRFADAKAIVALVNNGKGARWKNVEIWKAEKKE